MITIDQNDNPYLFYSLICFILAIVMYIFRKLGIQYAHQSGGTTFLFYVFSILTVANVIFYFTREKEIQKVKK